MRTVQNTLPGLLLLFFASLSLCAQEVQYQIRHFTVDHGLSHTDATAVTQDPSGLVWFSTFQGLNSFDGYEFRAYQDNRGNVKNVYSNRINDVLADNDVRIWLATEGGISCFNREKEVFETLLFHNLPEDFEKDRPVNKLVISENHLIAARGNNLVVFKIQGSQLHYVPLDKAISTFVFDMEVDASGNILIGALAGILRLRINDVAQVEQIQVFDDAGKAVHYILALEIDKNGQLWGASEHDLLLFDKLQIDNKDKISCRTYSLTTPQIQQLLPYANLDKMRVGKLASDKQGRIWCSTDQGLLQFNPGTRKFIGYYKTEPVTKYSLTSNHVNNVFIDCNNGLWATTFSGGVNFLNLSQKSFHLIQRDPLEKENNISSNYIRALAEDQYQNLWIGTRSDGLNYYDFKTNKVRLFQHDPDDPGSLAANNIRALVQDNQNRLWVGTSAGISVLEPGSETFINLKHDPKDSNSLSNNIIFSLDVDRFGQIWAGSWQKGLNRIEYKNGAFTVERICSKDHPDKKYRLCSDKITYVKSDTERNEVLVGTDRGLERIILNQEGTIRKIINYQGEENKTDGLSSNYIWPILRTSDSILWVGTIGGGLNRMRIDGEQEEYSSTTFGKEQGIPSMDIESMLADDKGRLWLGGQGLSCFSPQTGKLTNYDVNDGLQSNSFKIGAACKGASGRLYFGGTNGVNYFYPDSIRADERPESIVLNDLTVNNEVVQIGSKGYRWAILEKHLNESEKLRLSHRENNFAIGFAAPFFVNPDRCNYRYQLEGAEQNWVYTNSDNRKATYSNLDYGNYLFKVQVADETGEWMENGARLEVHIIPPWWDTVLARTIYLLSFFGVLIGVYYAIVRWFRLKKAYEISLLEEQQMEQLHQLQLQFFTNVSHEFKTPLTLIINPLERLLKGEVGERKSRRYFHMMHKNAQRLLQLINELMDFRKIETGSYRLQLQKQEDLRTFCKEQFNNFQEQAVIRELDYRFTAEELPEDICFDTEVLEKIMLNLLSNAFKYTPEKGLIDIKLMHKQPVLDKQYSSVYKIENEHRAKQYVWLTVSDSGVGISEESLQFIFNRYFQVGQIKEQKKLGSGVGLALVKSLVLLHKGDIQVYSESGKGTTFIIALPVGTQAYTPEEFADENALEKNRLSKVEVIQLPAMQGSVSETIDEPTTNVAAFKQLPKILVVEDNSELRRFLTEHFEEDYQIIEAADGQEGLEKARACMPDLIISDIMMPRMDGIAFCEAAKKDPALRYTPFFLLTAKASLQSKLEGTNAGADAYFAKPFSVELISLAVGNAIRAQSKLKDHYINNAFTEAREKAITSEGQSFMQELMAIIEKNLDNTSFDIDFLCKEVGMSRTKLYNKVKNLTNKSVGELIRGVRLQKAAQILVSQEISVREVMYQVGIQSQSYFTKSFRKEFGKTPTQFVSDLNKGVNK